MTETSSEFRAQQDLARATPPDFPADVDIAVVSHNGRSTLPRVLECLRACRAPFERLTVYDIGSTDDTATWLASDWPAVTVRRLQHNVGPNPARNWALRDASRPAVLLLDSDAYLRTDAPHYLRSAWAPAERVAMVAPVVVQTNRPEWIQYSSVGLHFICEAVNPWLDRPLSLRGSGRLDIATAPGVALLIDVAAAKRIGLFDERYFMGKDDGDFCYRLRMAGYRLVEEGRAIVEHENRPRTSWMFRFQIRNRWYFMLKNYGVRTLVVLLPALCVHEVLQFVLLAAKGHARSWWDAACDLWRWLPELPAARRLVQRLRSVPDQRLLVSAPLLVRQDLVGGRIGRIVKRTYDTWLAAYWAVARHVAS